MIFWCLFSNLTSKIQTASCPEVSYHLSWLPGLLRFHVELLHLRLAAFWGLQVTKTPSASLTSEQLEACKEWKKTNFCFGAFFFSVQPTVQLQSISIHSCSEWFEFECFTQGRRDHSNNNNHSLSPLRFVPAGFRTVTSNIHNRCSFSKLWATAALKQNIRPI